MTYREMKEADIELLIPLYMNYYNGKEDGQWTVQTTYKRVHQVLTREDSYCLVLEEDGRCPYLSILASPCVSKGSFAIVYFGYVC